MHIFVIEALLKSCSIVFRPSPRTVAEWVGIVDSDDADSAVEGSGSFTWSNYRAIFFY